MLKLTIQNQHDEVVVETSRYLGLYFQDCVRGFCKSILHSQVQWIGGISGLYME